MLKEPAIRRQEQAREFLLRCGIAFMARAKQLGKQNNLAGAMKDLTLAREAGVEETTIDMVKADLFDQKLAGVKAAMELQGLCSREVRLPLVPMTETGVHTLMSEMEKMMAGA